MNRIHAVIVVLSMVVICGHSFQLKPHRVSSRYGLSPKVVLPHSKNLFVASSTFTAHHAPASTSMQGKAFYSALIKFVPLLRSIIDPTIIGGLLAGGLHAITGPDHLAALLPSSVGKSGWVGARVGAIWGLGHGMSAIFLGLCAFFLKGKLTGRFSVLQKLTNLAESAVGVSLVAIGLLGVKESMEVDHSAESGEPTKKSMSSGAIFANGVLHGFSWDGAPSIAPAVAMTSWRSAIYFLLAYSMGTVVAMSVSAGTIGALSSRLGQISQAPDFPRGLSFFSSLLAVFIGLYWIVQGFL